MVVLERLRRDIVEGRRSPGELLREEEVAARLSVSRTPVREALAHLLAEGLLVKEESGTVKVMKPSLQDLREIYEIRLPLETLAAKLAATNATEEDVAELEDLWQSIEKASPGVEWSRQHEKFHMRLYEACQRPRLVSIIAGLRAQSEPYIRLGIQLDPALRSRGQHDHNNLLISLKEGDSRRIQRITDSHLKATIKRLPEIFGLDDEPE